MIGFRLQLLVGVPVRSHVIFSTKFSQSRANIADRLLIDVYKGSIVNSSDRLLASRRWLPTLGDGKFLCLVSYLYRMHCIITNYALFSAISKRYASSIVEKNSNDAETYIEQ